MKKKLSTIILILLVAVVSMTLASCTTELPVKSFEINFNSYYVLGQNLDGVAGKVIYENNAEKEITLKDCTVTGLDTSKLGMQEIVVKYGELEKKYTIEIRREFAVKFVAGEGGYVSGQLEQRVAEGASSTSVTAFANMGYVFETWSDGTKKAKNSVVNVNADITLTATFKKVVSNSQFRLYEVDFTNSNINSTRFIKKTDVTVVTGEKVAALPQHKEGFVFLGYSLERSYAGIMDKNKVDKAFIEKIENGEFTTTREQSDLYPVFVPNYYKIKVIDGSGNLGYADNIIITEEFNEFNKTINLKTRVDAWLVDVLKKIPDGYIYTISLKNEKGELEEITASDKFTKYTLTDYSENGYAEVVLNTIAANCKLIIKLDGSSTELVEIGFKYGTEKSFADVWTAISANNLLNFLDDQSYSVSISAYESGKYYDKDAKGNETRIFKMEGDVIATIKSIDRMYDLKVYNTPTLFENGDTPNYDAPSAVYETKTLKHGTVFARPTYKPFYKSADYYFYEYYTDEDCTQLYDFSSQLTKNTNIYVGYFVRQTFLSVENYAQIKYTRLSDKSSGIWIFTSIPEMYFKYGAHLREGVTTINALVKESATFNLFDVEPNAVLTNMTLKEYRENNASGNVIDFNSPIRARRAYYAIFENALIDVSMAVTANDLPYSGGAVYLTCAKLGHSAGRTPVFIRAELYYTPCSDLNCRTFVIANGKVKSEFKSALIASYKSEIGTLLSAVRIGGIKVADSAITKSVSGGITTYAVRVDINSANIKNNKVNVEWQLNTVNYNLAISESNSTTTAYVKDSEGLLIPLVKNGATYSIPYGTDITLKIAMNKGRYLDAIFRDGASISNFTYDENENCYVYDFGNFYKDSTIRLFDAIMRLDIAISDNGVGTGHITDSNYLTITDTKFNYGSNVYFKFIPKVIGNVSYRVENLYVNDILFIKNGEVIVNGEAEGILFIKDGFGYKLSMANQTKNIKISVIFAPASLAFSVSASGGDNLIDSVVIGSNDISVKGNNFIYNTMPYGNISYGTIFNIKLNLAEGYYVKTITVNGVKVDELPTQITENMEINLVISIKTYTVYLDANSANANGNECKLMDENGNLLNNSITYAYSKTARKYKIYLLLNTSQGYELSVNKIIVNGVETPLTFINNYAEFVIDNENAVIELSARKKEFDVKVTFNSPQGAGEITLGGVSSKDQPRVGDFVTMPTNRVLYGNNLSLIFNVANGGRVSQIIVTDKDNTNLIISDQAKILELIKDFVYLKNVTSNVTITIKYEFIQYAVNKSAVNSAEISDFIVKQINASGDEVDATLPGNYIYATMFKIYVTTKANYEIISLSQGGVTRTDFVKNGNTFIFTVSLHASGDFTPNVKKTNVVTFLNVSGLGSFATCKIMDGNVEIMPSGNQYILNSMTEYSIVIIFNGAYGETYSALVVVNGAEVVVNGDIAKVTFMGITNATIVVSVREKTFDMKLTLSDKPTGSGDSVTLMGKNYNTNGSWNLLAEKNSVVFMEISGTSKVKILVGGVVVFDAVPSASGSTVTIAQKVDSDLSIEVIYY